MTDEKPKKRKYKLKTIFSLCAALFICCIFFVFSGFAQEHASGNEAKKSSGTEEKELISLDLKGVEILELFKMLSIRTGLNIIPTKNVTGRVNLFLNKVAFEDILDIILVSYNLAAEKKGNIINVMTATEYEQAYGKRYNDKRKVVNLKLNYAKPRDVFTALTEIKSDIGKIVTDEATGLVILMDIPEKIEVMKEMIAELDQPAVTEIFELQYAQAEDLEERLTSILSGESQTVQVDKRTNKIMVTDLKNRMQEIRKMVEEFDVPTRQVLIETDIWQLALTDKFERGVDWEKIFRGLDNLDFAGYLPISLTSAYQQISMGTVASDDYDATIQLLSTYGKTDILSRPRIAVVDGEEAKILIGSKEAYITTTLSQAESSTTTSESVEYIDVGVQLSVSPEINQDGFVTMKIKPSVSSVRETLTTDQGTQVPIVETNEVETTVKVKDGNTIFIAGLIKETKQEYTYGVPFLSRIPIIKWFFSKYQRGPDSGPVKTELIICITPRIITGEEGTLKISSGSKLGTLKDRKQE